jgi:hypothetical protein
MEKIKIEDVFNTIPFIDTSKSDEFKTKAQYVLEKIIPSWVDNSYIEYDESKSEDDPSNVIASKISRINKGYIKERIYHRTPELPHMVVHYVLTELFKQVIIYTNKDLVEQIKKACAYLSHLEDYIGVTEDTMIMSFKKIKSSEWILHEAMKYLNPKPYCLLPYDTIKKNGVYLIMDDAIYSGGQMCSHISQIIRNTQSSVIYIVPMYASEVGIEAINRTLTEKSKTVVFDKTTMSWTLPNHKVYLWNDYIPIPSVKNIFRDIFTRGYQMPGGYEKVIDSIYSSINSGASIVVFEHKLPDYLSLPEIIANVFYIAMPEHYSKMPPYNPPLKVRPSITSNYTFNC